MNYFAPAELAKNMVGSAQKKTSLKLVPMFVLGILAGALIAFGAVAANTATHAVTNVGLSRLLSGLIFPFGLAMVVMVGAELFTGNCLISIGVFAGEVKLRAMLLNWVIVYLGNLVGSLLVSGGCALFGQLSYSANLLAVSTVKIAVSKCSMPFFNVMIQGIFCNILVCLGVLLANTGKDTAGRMLGAYVPVAAFVIAGFEHCIANMYYIPAGLFAMLNPDYAAAVSAAGVDTAALTLGNFIGNLIPATIGNILGGVAISFVMWLCYLKKEK